jgi:putative membrane protein
MKEHRWRGVAQRPAEEVLPMMWYWGNGMHWWGWLLGAAAMVAFWSLLFWGIWYFVSGTTRRPDQEQGHRNAEGILDERLARGEIDADEYRRLRDLLRGYDAAGGPGRTPVGAGDRR